MFFGKITPHHQLRTLLVLGRVSNLPTVWSNCLAAWFLGGGGPWRQFGLLCVSATCLYIAGMYLNDAFDVEFDREHRKERPIPSGAIESEHVWFWGVAWLILGLVSAAFLGKVSAMFAVALALSIVVYDAFHKMITFSPVLMAACRFFLYLLAGSTALEGNTGLTVWSAVVLGAYIVGLSYIARTESLHGPLRFWPCCFLAAPIVLGLIVNNGDYRVRGLLLSLVLAIWIGRCLLSIFSGSQRNVGRTVSGLLAGIVLVDLLAVGGATPGLAAFLVLLFAAALLFQKFIPAT